MASSSSGIAAAADVTDVRSRRTRETVSATQSHANRRSQMPVRRLRTTSSHVRSGRIIYAVALQITPTSVRKTRCTAAVSPHGPQLLNLSLIALTHILYNSIYNKKNTHKHARSNLKPPHPSFPCRRRRHSYSYYVDFIASQVDSTTIAPAVSEALCRGRRPCPRFGDESRLAEARAVFAQCIRIRGSLSLSPSLALSLYLTAAGLNRTHQSIRCASASAAMRARTTRTHAPIYIYSSQLSMRSIARAHTHTGDGLDICAVGSQF